jgi:hypothetical protein
LRCKGTTFFWISKCFDRKIWLILQIKFSWCS